jgi:phosphate transport system substrate-binding protein
LLLLFAFRWSLFHPLENKILTSMKSMKIITVIAAIASAATTQTPIDPALPAYKKTSGVSGTLNSIGSDTMNNLMTYWAEGFKEFYPNVKMQIEGKGSSTAPPALIAQTAQLGPMSRQMKDVEIDQFEGVFGFKPTTFCVAIDAIAVYVNMDNPLQSVSMQQLDAIFSKTRRGGSLIDITRWGELGLPGIWSRRAISLYGRNSASGTYSYFKEHALFKGDFKNIVKEQPGSGSVVHAVTLDRDAIGYAGIGYLTSGVRALSLKIDNDTAVPPTMQTALSGEYPLSRSLYIYVNQKPGAPLDPLVREFLKFIFSAEGQRMVVKDGYLPLPVQIAQREMAALK